MRIALRLGAAIVAFMALSVAAHSAASMGTGAAMPLAGPAAAHFPAHSARVYRVTPRGDALRLLDPRSLADRQSGALRTNLRASSNQNTNVLGAPDGLRFLVVNELTGGPWPRRARDLSLQLFDVSGKALAAAWHPPVPLGVAAVSTNGSLAAGIPWSSSDATCGPSQVYLLDTRTGAVIRRVHLDIPAWMPMLFDPALRYAYGLRVRDGINACGSSGSPHPTLIAYDLRTGTQIRSIVLTNVTAGAWLTNQTVAGQPVGADWTPGFALSPDGRQIAIFDGSSDTLTLLAAPSLRLEGSEHVARRRSPLDDVFSTLGLAPAVAEAKGQNQGQRLTMQYMPDGRALLVAGTRFVPDARQPVRRAVSLGIRLIDVAGGVVMAAQRDGGQVSGIWVAPDGSAVYSEVQARRNGLGWVTILRRHDPVTLLVEARRILTRAGWVGLVFLRGR